MAVTTDAPVPPRSLRPEISEAMESVILRCLRKDPAERYPTVAALVSELEPLGSGRSWVAEPPPDPAPPSSQTVVVDAGAEAQPPAVAAVAARTEASWGTTARSAPRSRSRRRGGILAGAIGVVAVGAGFMTLRASHPPVDATAHSASEVAPPVSVTQAGPPVLPSPASASPAVAPSSAAAPAPLAMASASSSPVRASPSHSGPRPMRRQTPAAPIDPGSVR
jgi:serine/threonine-protein kinase